jgi:hypothetical protein
VIQRCDGASVTCLSLYDGVLGKLVFWEFCTLVEDVAEQVAPDEPLQEVFDEVCAMIIERGGKSAMEDVAQQESLMVWPGTHPLS